MDHTQKASSLIKDEGSAEGMEKSKKSCTDCKTTTTPLWRVGPTGPRTLCNACGIRYRKKKEGEVCSSSPPPRKSQQQQSKSGEQQQQSKSPQRQSMSPRRQKTNNHPPQQQSKGSSQLQRKRDRPSSSTGSLANAKSAGMGMVREETMMLKEKKSQSLVESQSQASQVMKKQRSSRRLGEVERAAVLLLSLSA